MAPVGGDVGMDEPVAPAGGDVGAADTQGGGDILCKPMRMHLIGSHLKQDRDI